MSKNARSTDSYLIYALSKKLLAIFQQFLLQSPWLLINSLSASAKWCVLLTLASLNYTQLCRIWPSYFITFDMQSVSWLLLEELAYSICTIRHDEDDGPRRLSEEEARIELGKKGTTHKNLEKQSSMLVKSNILPLLLSPILLWLKLLELLPWIWRD